MKRILLLVLLSFAARAELWMPSIFDDGMVLQCDKPVPVWGEADPGAEVTVEFAGRKKSATADFSNHWKITLDPMPASSDPRQMKVSSNSNTPPLQYSDLLVGEVWILAGQSNMGWPLKNCDGGPGAAEVADYPWLKIFRQWPYQGACDEPARDVTGGQWLPCTPDQAAQLSGVGFFFARALHKSLPPDTPVALINTQMGGTYAECWIDFQTLENTPSARPYLDKAAREIRPGEVDPKGYWGENNFRRPAAMFNGKVAPLQPMAARGVVWYQGEGNSQQWLVPGYAGTLTALINSWRAGFEQPGLSFLIVQLPRFGTDGDWPAVRAAQAQVAEILPGVELAVTIDLGQQEHIHPSDKEPVGERLSLLAQSAVYGQKVACRGPFFQGLEKSDGSLLLTFSNSEGLHLKGTTGFEICGEDGIFFEAVPEMMNGAVKLSSPEVRAPAAARYGWSSWGDVSLFNGQGLPAAPFATENK
jgi:sialate O-acetylesterase